VSATSYALCWGVSARATRHTAAVECRRPGLTPAPLAADASAADGAAAASGGGDGVESASLLRQYGVAQAAGFTFIAMESAPGSPS